MGSFFWPSETLTGRACLIIMRTLPLLTLISSLLILPCFGAVENNTKDKPDSAEKSNQEKGPNFSKLNVTDVSKEDLTAFVAAWRKANQDDNIIGARQRLADARKRLQESSGADKKDALSAIRSATDELRIELRKGIQKAEPKLKVETIEKLMDAIEDQIKSRMQEKKNTSTSSGTKNS